MRRRGDISLGDLVIACRKLEADHATASAIARLLGLPAFAGLEETAVAEPRPRSDLESQMLGADAREEAGLSAPEGSVPLVVETSPVVEQPPESVPPPLPEEVAPEDVALEEVAPEEEAAPVIPSRLRDVNSQGVNVPQTSAETQFLPRNSQPGGASLPFEPLLLPVWARAILSGTLSSRTDDGPFDLRKIVERIAGGEASAELPRLPRPTLAHGVQMLVDRSEAMLLFLEDQGWLENEILKVVGPARAQVLYFEGCPSRRAGRGSRRRWKNYFEYYLPRSGTVVFLLTDLGAAPPVTADVPVSEGEWLDFTRRLREHGCPLVAFVPYALARYGNALHRLITIIQWDRTTSASSVHARVGMGHTA